MTDPDAMPGHDWAGRSGWYVCLKCRMVSSSISRPSEHEKIRDVRSGLELSCEETMAASVMNA